MKTNEVKKGIEKLTEVSVQDVTTTKGSKKKAINVSDAMEREKTPIARVYDYAANSQRVIFAGLCSQMVESWKVVKNTLKSGERVGLLRDFLIARQLSDNFTLQLERIPITNENGEKTTTVGYNWVACKVSTLAGIRSIINDAKLQLRRERMTAKKELNAVLYEKAAQILGFDRAKVDTLKISTIKNLIAELS